MKNDFYHSTVLAIGLLLAFLTIVALILLNGGFPIPLYILIILGVGTISVFASGFLV